MCDTLCCPHTKQHTMSQVNITQAAQLAGISRSHFHRHYVKTGKVNATKDSKGKPQIDIAELLRVFGVLNDPGSESSTVDSTAHDSTPHHIQQHTLKKLKYCDNSYRKPRKENKNTATEKRSTKNKYKVSPTPWNYWKRPNSPNTHASGINSGSENSTSKVY